LRHCDSQALRACQSRRCLESGSLSPPPAALRRFPFGFPPPLKRRAKLFLRFALSFLTLGFHCRHTG